MQDHWVVILAVSFLLAREGFCLCFISSHCNGSLVPAANTKECCVGTDDGLSFSDGTNCTLCIVHGFVRSAYNVIERNTLDTQFRLNVKGETRLGSALVISGIIAVEADGTADQSDFGAVLPIPVENSAAEIHLFTAADDSTLEYNDSVLLRFTPSISDLIVGLENEGEYIRDNAIVNIIDNDKLTISLQESDYSIMEGSNLSTPIRVLFEFNQNPFTLVLRPVTIDTVESEGLGSFINSDTIRNSSRATADADFTSKNVTVEVPAKREYFDLPQFFSVLDDDISENVQSFAIIVEIGKDVPDYPTNFSCFRTFVGEKACHGRSGAAKIRIIDSDGMIIGFTQRSQTVCEGDVPPGNNFQSLTINIATLRTSERVYILLFRHLESSSTALVESNITQHNTSFDALFGNEVTEETYILLPGEDTIPPLITAVRNDFRPEFDECYTISISTMDTSGIRDSFMCNDGDNVTEYFCYHTVCIENDDELYAIAFVQTTYTVFESEGSVEVCVNLTRPSFDILHETISVIVMNDANSIYVPSGSRLATPDVPDFLSKYSVLDGTDYAEQTLGVNLIDDKLITEEMRLVCYNQTIYDDMRLELSEYAGLTLGVRQATVATEVRETYDYAAIEIVDNDMAVVGLDTTFSQVLESVGVVEVCAAVIAPAIVCPIEFPFNISFSTDDRNAGRSFVALSVVLTFDICETKQCVNVTIVDNSVDEPDISFSYTLKKMSGLDPRITLAPSAGEVVILDDDEPFAVAFVETAYTVTEDEGKVEVCINLTRPTIDILDETVRVYIINDPSSVYIPRGAKLAAPDKPDFISRTYLMMAGTDYAEQTLDVNLIDNELITEETRIVCYNQTIYNDLQLEESEYIGLTLGVRQATVLTQVQPLHDVAAIQILDNEEMAVVGLEKIFYKVAEDVDDVELCAMVTTPATYCPIDFSFSVSLSTHDRSAGNPMDYDTLSVILTFAACDVRRCVNVSIVDDMIDEPDERFSYTLERTSGLDFRIKLTPSAGEVVITDDDGRCFTGTDCSGSPVSAANARECCVGTDDGLSFGDADTCTTCSVHGFSKGVYYVYEGKELEATFQLYVKGWANISSGLGIQGTISAEAGGTAGNSDFEIQNTSVHNSTTEIPLLAINDDVTLEYDDSVLLTFIAENPGTVTALQDRGHFLRENTIVNIIDTDRLEITFEEPYYSLTEGLELSVPVRLQFLNTQNPFNLTLRTVSIATADNEGLSSLFDYDTIKTYSRATAGADFTAATLMVEVPANSNVFDLPQFFNIINDNINENEQSFVLVAEIGPDVANSPTNFSCFQTQAGEMECPGRSGVTEIKIVDTDSAVVGLERQSQQVTEDMGVVEVCANVTFPSTTCPIEFPFNISLTTTDKSAGSPMDYEPLTVILPFTACDVRQCVNVSIVDDMIDEPEERFSYTLERTSTLNPRIALDPSAGEVVIVDNDDFIHISTARKSAVDGVVVAVIILAVVVVLSVTVVGAICVKRKNRKTAKKPAVIPSINLVSLADANGDKNSADDQHITHELQQLSAQTDPAQQLQNELRNRKMLFLKRNLHLGDVVGQGESGLVYRGYLDTAQGRELVALKTVKALSSPNEKVKLLKEVTVMLSFQHPNIMTLLGLCFDEETPLLIMPFMSGGTVLSYVRSNKEMLYFVNETDSDTQIEAARKTCVDICCQICKGMSYLTKHKFVHRDLAARNCMLDQHGVIKVSDFGLTEEMYGTNYFRRRKSVNSCEEKVPIRWMAQESIENSIYNEASDMWSFGVTCWEVFTCGSVPYAGVPALTLLRELSSGHRLPRPSNAVCCDEIWSMMMSCWSECPHKRPHFSNIVDEISLLLETYSPYLKLSTDD